MISRDFAAEHGIPIAETMAGKGARHAPHPAHIGPIGVVGSTSANKIAGEADVVLADRHAPAGFHHRLVDVLLAGRAIHLDQRRAL